MMTMVIRKQAFLFAGIILFAFLLISASSVHATAPASGSVIMLQDVNSNLCVDTAGSTGFVPLVQSPCSNGNSQAFTLTASPQSGWYYLKNNASNLCLDIVGGSTSAGALVQQYTCTTVWPEYFELQAVTGGYKILSGNMVNGCIGIVGASTASGANLEQNTCNGSTNQTFVMNAPGSAPPATPPPPASTTTTTTTVVPPPAPPPSTAPTSTTTGTAIGTVRNVRAYGAIGNGSTDDTAAINSAISALQSGDTLLFPCGTYKTTSQLTINKSNITVDGSGCAVIKNTAGAGIIMDIGGSGNGNPNYGPAVALSATAGELSTNFTTVSNLGLAAGDYVYLHQGGKDSSGGSGDTGCDPSGCRGELVKVSSVSGNTATVITALHDTFSPSVNAAVAQKILNPISGVNVKNITLDGSASAIYGLAIAGVTDSMVSGVTARNVQGSALLNRGDFNVSWTNIAVTGAGSAQCGSAAWFEQQGSVSINGLTVSQENPGASGSGCLANGAFGFELITSANNTLTNVTVDAAGAYGRPFKITAARWNTFNSLTVKNGVQAYNGISPEYYSSHNTFNNCVVTNNGAGTGTGSGNAGINMFGNFNQYNTFNNCTVTGNGNIQFYDSGFDALRLGQNSFTTINGGTYTGTNNVEPPIYMESPNPTIMNATVNGPGSYGIIMDYNAANACVSNNSFGAGTGLGGAISSNNATNIGSGNILNSLSSSLTSGTCAVSSAPPSPPPPSPPSVPPPAATITQPTSTQTSTSQTTPTSSSPTIPITIANPTPNPSPATVSTPPVSSIVGGGGGSSTGGSSGNGGGVSLPSFPTGSNAVTSPGTLSIGSSTVSSVDPRSLLISLSAQLKVLIAQLNQALVQGFTRDLTISSQGEDVKNLQTFLNDNGYPITTSGPGSIGNETSYFGQKTAQALIKFQQANGIRATGYFGPMTRALIQGK